MAKRRRFTDQFKRMVVEEYLSGSSTQAQLSRRYQLSPNLIPRWREAYAGGKLSRSNDPDMIVKDARIQELERMVGKLVMENELLKKAAEFARQKQSESISIATGPSSDRSKRGAR